MPLEASVLIGIISVIFLIIFLAFFIVFAIFFLRWLRVPRAYYIPVRVEDYMCPKCGSKELEIIGARTLRCKKCGIIFTLRESVPEGYWVIWPFFWWFPMVLLIRR